MNLDDGFLLLGRLIQGGTCTFKEIKELMQMGLLKAPFTVVVPSYVDN